jgi:hypothetical protein
VQVTELSGRTQKETPKRVAAGTQPSVTDRAFAGSNRKSLYADFRPDVEGLRAVAVVAVLLYHAGLPLARGGYVGVDVFFVISVS